MKIKLTKKGIELYGMVSFPAGFPFKVLLDTTAYPAL
jgi:hypothetical protein